MSVSSSSAVSTYCPFQVHITSQLVLFVPHYNITHFVNSIFLITYTSLPATTRETIHPHFSAQTTAVFPVDVYALIPPPPHQTTLHFIPKPPYSILHPQHKPASLTSHSQISTIYNHPIASLHRFTPPCPHMRHKIIHCPHLDTSNQQSLANAHFPPSHAPFGLIKLESVKRPCVELKALVFNRLYRTLPPSIFQL